MSQETHLSPYRIRVKHALARPRPVFKGACSDSARACKKLGGPCFDFDYCVMVIFKENFKLVGSLFLKTEHLLLVTTSVCESDGRKYGL